MKLSVVVPVFNERATVLDVIRRVQTAGIPAELDIVVVDDGSTDGTRELLNGVADRAGVRVHRTAGNGGKGLAVRKGIELAQGEWIVIQDADLELDPADLPRLLSLVTATGAQPGTGTGIGMAVYGSRFLDRPHRWRSIDYWGNRALTALTNRLYGSRLTDMLTCYKLFPAAFLKPLALVSCGFEIEAELTGHALRRGLAVREVPIQYHPRGIAQGKKLRRHHGFAVLWMLLRRRFSPAP